MLPVPGGRDGVVLLARIPGRGGDLGEEIGDRDAVAQAEADIGIHRHHIAFVIELERHHLGAGIPAPGLTRIEPRPTPDRPSSERRILLRLVAKAVAVGNCVGSFGHRRPSDKSRLRHLILHESVEIAAGVEEDPNPPVQIAVFLHVGLHCGVMAAPRHTPCRVGLCPDRRVRCRRHGARVTASVDLVSRVGHPGRLAKAHGGRRSALAAVGDQGNSIAQQFRRVRRERIGVLTHKDLDGSTAGEEHLVFRRKIDLKLRHAGLIAIVQGRKLSRKNQRPGERIGGRAAKE